MKEWLGGEIEEIKRLGFPYTPAQKGKGWRNSTKDITYEKPSVHDRYCTIPTIA